jgi:SOS-response transcriptional repressor LexA
MTNKTCDPLNLEIGKLLTKNLLRLQKESGLTQLQIAKIANIPPSTISGIFLGNSVNSKLYTLAAISRVFNKTIGQLIGEIPLNFIGTAIPILEWQYIDVSEKTINYTHSADTSFIFTNLQTNNRVFAFKVDDKISSIYSQRSLIILEETKDFTHLDLIVVSINNSEPIVKKVLQEGDGIFLESISHNIPTSNYQKNITHVFGIIRETRF